MSTIRHSINQIRGLRPSISHYFLMNLENFVEKKDLRYYKEMTTLYRYKDIKEVIKTFEKYGRVISTPIGIYVETENAVVLLDLTSDDLSGVYLHIEFFYNSKVSISKLEGMIFNDQTSFECKDIITRIDWQFKSKDFIDSISLYEVNKTVLYDEAYPYVKDSVDKYIQGFLDSDETILIMIGPAGTGKTKLIKYIMKYMADLLGKELDLKKSTSVKSGDDVEYPEDVSNKKTFIVSYSASQETYQDDEFFIDFVKGDSSLLILEDIDYNLRTRTDGNTFMHKLLNTSDGIVELKKKKIIITTNLETEQKTDSALLRPGRTFDVLKTRYLNLQQATELAQKLGTKFDIKKPSGKYSLAEIYKNRIEVMHSVSFN